MATPYRRSKRQLYIGIVFITLAIMAALLRSYGPGSSPASQSSYVREDELIGMSEAQAIEQLGEPTARLEFMPGEDNNPLRMQVTDRLSESEAAPTEPILELSWFGQESITTVWFVRDKNSAGSEAQYQSIDAVRYPRGAIPQDGTPLD